MKKLIKNLSLICFILILTSLSVSAILVGDFESATVPYNFVGLNDTPSAYTGSGLYSVIVNAAEDALEFFDMRSWVTTNFRNASDDDWVNITGDTMTGDLYGQNIYPNESLTYDLGSGANRWDTLWVQDINAEGIDSYYLIASDNVTAPIYCDNSGCFNLTEMNNSILAGVRWITNNPYLYNDTNTIYFNDTKSNETYVNVDGDTMTGYLDMGNNEIEDVKNINLSNRIYHDGDDDTYIDFGNDRIVAYVDGAEAMDYYGTTEPHFIHIGHDDSFKVRIADDTMVINATEDFVQVYGSLNATETICDVNGCIGENLGINGTYANETFVPYIGATDNVDLGAYNL